jgi:hypothetical protein
MSLALLGGACGKKDESKPAPAPVVVAPTPVAPPVAEPPRAPLAADPGGATGDASWLAGFGGKGEDEPRGVDIDAAGNTVVTGIFNGQLTMGETVLESQALDAFVAKLDPDGKVLWAHSFGGKNDDVASAVSFDSKGNVVVLGWYSDVMQFGTSTLTAVGSDDVFVMQLGPDGSPNWARSIGGENTEAAWSVTTTPSDDIIVIGEFRGTVNFGAGPIESAGNTDVFVVSLGKDGEQKWARHFGDMNFDFGRAVAIDSRGDLVLAAEFAGTVDFGGGALEAAGNRDIAVVKLGGADGAFRWAKRFGNTFDDVVLGLSLDAADNIAIGGSYEAENPFEKGATSNGRKDAFVARLDPTGVVQWSRSWGGDRDDQVSGVASDKFGNVVATGWFVNKAGFGGAELESPNGNRDAFLVKLNADGGHVWSQRFGDRDHDRGRAIATTPEGEIAMAGAYRFTLSAGDSSIESVHPKKAKIAPADVFVARFRP